MSDESKLRLVLRGYTIASDAPVSASGGEMFVAVPKPPPVGSVLEAYDGDARQLLQVVRVIESEGDGRGRGFFGRARDEDDQHLLLRVGSEKLAAAAPSRFAALAADAAPAEDPGPSYAVPAPVLEPEPSEPIDVGRPDEIAMSAAAEQADPAGDEEAEAEGQEASDEGGDTDAGSDAPKGRGKKRKGRKRG